MTIDSERLGAHQARLDAHERDIGEIKRDIRQICESVRRLEQVASLGRGILLASLKIGALVLLAGQAAVFVWQRLKGG